MEPSKPDVYILYSVHDRSAAEILARRLREAGFEPWLDSDIMRSGGSFQKDFQDRLRQCKSCLVILGRLGPDNFKSIGSQASIGGGIGDSAIGVAPIGGSIINTDINSEILIAIERRLSNCP